MSVSGALPQDAAIAIARGLLPFLNVKDAPYRAKGDGTTDDTAAIQAALAAVATGGTIFFPRGSYRHSATIPLKGNVTYRGEGSNLSRLLFTGSGDALTANEADNGGSGVYRARVEGLKIEFGGTGTTANGLRADGLRESHFTDVHFLLFPASGVRLDGSLGAGLGCWSNLWENVYANQNGKHGWEAYDQCNANIWIGCMSNLNALDGFNLEKAQGCSFPTTHAEGNGRHGFHLRGVRVVDLSGAYVEHQDPGTFPVASQPPGYVKQSPRYCVYVTQASDGSRSQSVVIAGMLLQGEDNGTTSWTDACVYAEACTRLQLGNNYYSSVHTNNHVQIQSSVDVVVNQGGSVNNLADIAANGQVYMAALHQSGSRAPLPIDRRGPMGYAEGTQNLLRNGGFEQWTTAPGVPDCWTQHGLGTFVREVGTDGGNRLAITNLGTNQSSIKQLVDGPAVAQMAIAGKGVLVLDASIPTTNVANSAHVRVICQDGSGAQVVGGMTNDLNRMEKTDVEQTHVLPFFVAATTKKIEVRLYASDGNGSNGDVARFDRVALYAGEVPKAFQSRAIVEGEHPLASIATKTAAYTVVDADATLLGNATAAAFTLTLPTAVGRIGKQFTIKKIDSSANAVTVDGNASETIDGALTKALGSQWAFLTIVSDGANWQIVAQGGPIA